jgi:hypothetical protein
MARHNPHSPRQIFNPLALIRPFFINQRSYVPIGWLNEDILWAEIAIDDN